MAAFRRLSVVALCAGYVFGWSAGPWDKYIHAPTGRTVRSSSVHSADGSVERPTTTSALFTRTNSTLVLDFGKQVGGRISVSFGAQTSPNAALGVGFSESTQFITPLGSDLSQDMSNPDLYITFTPAAGVNSTLVAPSKNLRGGFRYLSLFALSDAVLEVVDVSLEYTPAPQVADASSLGDYNGYFYAKNDDVLNRIFYAGAHTIQLNTIGAGQGRKFPPVFSGNSGWDDSAPLPPLSADQVVLVDGAKRDRTAWPGDLGVALESAFVSGNVGAMESVKNNLVTQWARQDSRTGELPWVGPPVYTTANPNWYVSDVYSMWAIVSTRDYWAYTGDIEYIRSIWSQYLSSINWVISKVESTGMFLCTHGGDWGRAPNDGHSLSANTLAFRSLQGAIQLATVLGQNTDLIQGWNATAHQLRTAVNAALWDDGQGMYRDKDGSTLYPQDGNTLAVLFDIADTTQAARISSGLLRNWNQFGAVAPEASGTISTFVSSFEVKAHFKAGNPSTAVELMRFMWGYALNTFSSSTIVEGYFKDGSLHYPSYGGANSYISNSHAWATGPTTSLIFHLLGLRPDLCLSTPNMRSTLDGAWIFSPETEISSAQGGFRTALGEFTAQWTFVKQPAMVFSATVTAPAGAPGKIAIPVQWQATVVVDGVIVYDAANGPQNGAELGAGRVLLQVDGGTHTVDAR
ncbi:glycoside hydrolase family 78 protein [Mycena rebaudengoi]|nr:glycoside hydrolase family 78 protein [Mycena rebaudengoi]